MATESNTPTQPTFDYSVWTPNTTVTMCNVPWDNSYRNVVSFEDAMARDSYFESLTTLQPTVEMEGFVYLRYGEPVLVNVPFSACNHCNYIVVRNKVQPVPSHGGRRVPDVFYYFVNDVQYVAPNTTQLNIQLDVWTTYCDRVRFGYCYVERGHVGIANENATMSTLSDYLVEPEGLEQGREYFCNSVQGESFLNDPPFMLIVSSADLKGDFGSKESPNLSTAISQINDGVPSGCEVYAVSGENFKKALDNLSSYPWVSQCISQISIVPYKFIRNLVSNPIKIINGTTDAYQLAYTPQNPISLNEVRNPRQYFGIPARYANLLKFYTFPYTTIEATNYEGSTLNFSLDSLDDGDTLYMEGEATVCPPFIRAWFSPHGIRSTGAAGRTFDYRTANGDASNVSIATSDQLEGAVTFSDFPQCSVLNNQYVNYMASNARTLNYQEHAASWSQQKALTAARLSFDQSSRALDASMRNTYAGNEAAWQQTGIANQQTAWGGLTSAGGALASGVGSGSWGGAAGGVANAALAGVNAGLSMTWNNQKTGVSTGLAMTQALNAQALGRYNRDTNYDYANFAAKGDYQNAIASIQAKVQDAQLTPPTLSGVQGGNAFAISKGYTGLWLKFKRPALQFVHQIGEFWLRYGYAINRFIKVDRIMVMSKFTYWKMQSCAVFGEMPEVHRNAIRGIFESGVTLWANPDDIDRIDFATNRPESGVSY